jgi:crotonobetainyl-CoA:carnitine CoA-transferase CaiB-like acyl-CoA transferase
VVVAVTSEREWAELCRAVGHPEWQGDPRFATAEARRANHDALDALLAGWTRARAPEEAMDCLQAVGVPAGAVLGAADLAANRHLAARDFFQAAGDGSGLYPGSPVRLEHGGGQVRHRGPDLGADNAAVRGGLLGRPAEEIEPLDPDRLGTAFDEA